MRLTFVLRGQDAVGSPAPVSIVAAADEAIVRYAAWWFPAAPQGCSAGLPLSEAEAQTAIQRLNDQSFGGQKLMANVAKSPGSGGGGPRKTSRW